ncbi:uncharacterized protein A1O9_03158 [Exophiala aquamarina CBS 119918]|uniref:Uncharacterized protein n=1 Tax=Exophiala aquamarina CBS 119918 TaxID=1182545 RepID=A0A072Q106_9EURO|nr:uncharacterized protein A1O9_03158 [Exophiala aquamarina CBS 119918]KEF61590.1 hypothetical protein A1O9_03158 [Exophiala aquamarina CBS 119918]
MTPQTAIEEFNSLLSSSSVLFVVCKLRLFSSLLFLYRSTLLPFCPPNSSSSLPVYRGHWCPFCRAYLRTLQGLSPSIASLGGKTLIVTSEPASFLPETLTLTRYSGDAIVDTQNTLVEFVKERYGLEIAVTERKGYENGMAQPGILVLRGGKAGDMTGVVGAVLEKWAIVPSAMNLGGASDRPDLEQVWENVRAKIDGKAVVHNGYKRMGLLGLLWGKVWG